MKCENCSSKHDGSYGSGRKGTLGLSCHIRNYLFRKHDSKCQECGWNKVHTITGKIPLVVYHIDGNYLNNVEENLELLCGSCHTLTPNYGSLNIRHKSIYIKDRYRWGRCKTSK